MKSSFLLLLLFISFASKAQPYLDLANGRYVYSPDAGFINHNKNPVVLTYGQFATNLPIKFKNGKDVLILSPFFEYWEPQIDHKASQYYGLALPIGLLKTFNENWSALMMVIPRINGAEITFKDNFQFGGAFLLSKKVNPDFTWKAGLYVNKEFFGLYVMALFGIDWKIDDRNNLFGVLPGNFVYEHKVSKSFYWGAAFRALTNSYNDVQYTRFDENQLGLYTDFYLTPKLVLNIEGGHTILRKIRQENLSGDGKKYIDLDVNDNLYIKAGLAYRLRFR
jgi:hypothetical protein